MSIARRSISAVAVVAVAAVAFASCGAGGSSETVARIGGVTSISKATVEHWIPVEASVLYQEQPTKPVPKGVVPSPPNYTACIAYLKVTPQKDGEALQQLTVAQAKGKCKQRYDEIKVLTLNTLIGWYWTIGAGEALGVRPSAAEVQRRYEKDQGLFKSKAEFINYLKFTGQTTSDMRLRSKVQLFETKLLAKLTALKKAQTNGTPAQRRELAKFVEKLPEGTYWKERTTCHKGYVVSACKQYKGNGSPALPD
jgi:hypothetical protein